MQALQTIGWVARRSGSKPFGVWGLVVVWIVGGNLLGLCIYWLAESWGSVAS